jgi:hypothetical protein
MSIYVVEPDTGLTKHLSGQHDQQRHAGGRGRASRNKLPDNVEDLWGKDARHMNAQLSGALVEDTIRSYDSYGGAEPNSEYQVLNVHENRVHAKQTGQKATVEEMLKNPEVQERIRDNYGNFDPEFIDPIARESLMTSSRDIVERWSYTSYDQDKRGHQTQDVAEDVLNIKDAYKRHESEARYGGEDYSDEMVGWTIKAQQQATQKWFADHGFDSEDEITLFRGVDDEVFKLSDRPKLKAGVKTTIQQQPLSSWTTNPGVANGFGPNLLMANIKVKDIHSSPYSGFGCLPEFEFVVLGGLLDVVGFKLPDTLGNDFYQEFINEGHYDDSGAGSKFINDTLFNIQNYGD